MIKFELVKQHDTEPHYSLRDVDVTVKMFLTHSEDMKSFLLKGVVVQDRDHKNVGELVECELKDLDSDEIIEVDEFNQKYKVDLYQSFTTWFATV